MAKMNMFLHDYTDSDIRYRRHLHASPASPREGAGLQQFDYVVANPMWNQDNYDEDFYENDPWQPLRLRQPAAVVGRLGLGAAHPRLAERDGPGGGGAGHRAPCRAARAARQSNKERDIRKAFVEADLIEGVVLLPENLFYNTTRPGHHLAAEPRQARGRQGQILLVNASAYFVKEKPKNVLTAAGIAAVAGATATWETPPEAEPG